MSKRRRNAASTTRREKAQDVFVARPFEGLADEAEWIALRELVPAATAPLTLSEEYAAKFPDRTVELATVLPMAWPAMVRPDGRILLGLQRQFQSGDVSRDLAASLESALATDPGQTVAVPALPGPGPRLQDMLGTGPLDVTLQKSFEFWVEEGAADDPNVSASLEQANANINPTERMPAAKAAYWCRVPGRTHVRWVLPDDEDAALDALARLSAAGTLTLGENTRFAGMFRAHGRLAPVWDLPADGTAEQAAAPFEAVTTRYAEALAGTEPLSPPERRARQGLLGRQLTLR